MPKTEIELTEDFKRLSDSVTRHLEGALRGIEKNAHENLKKLEEYKKVYSQKTVDYATYMRIRPIHLEYLLDSVASYARPFAEPNFRRDFFLKKMRDAGKILKESFEEK